MPKSGKNDFINRKPQEKGFFKKSLFSVTVLLSLALVFFLGNINAPIQAQGTVETQAPAAVPAPAAVQSAAAPAPAPAAAAD